VVGLLCSYGAIREALFSDGNGELEYVVFVTGSSHPQSIDNGCQFVVREGIEFSLNPELLAGTFESACVAHSGLRKKYSAAHPATAPIAQIARPIEEGQYMLVGDNELDGRERSDASSRLGVGAGAFPTSQFGGVAGRTQEDEELKSFGAGGSDKFHTSSIPF
jgi:hypothetical protein